MAIVIRLQYLPLSAKLADIRQFFDGLSIPNGGVHIIGGSKEDAFIVFNSDEDARLAMQRDGKRILGARVKLCLSSHAEMQHEIGKIKKKIVDPSAKISPDRSRRSSKSPSYGNSNYHSRSSSGKVRGFSPSHRSRSPKRSRSPRRYSRSPRRYSMSPRRQSRSPRRYSRSPRKHSKSPRRSPKRYSRSPRRSSRSPRRSSRSPKRSSKSPNHLMDLTSLIAMQKSATATASDFTVEARADSPEDANLLKLKKLFGLECTPKEVFEWQSDEPKKKVQTTFEQKFANVLSTGLSSLVGSQNPYHKPNSLGFDLNKSSKLFNSPSSNLLSQSTAVNEMSSSNVNSLLMSQILSATNVNQNEGFGTSTPSFNSSMSAHTFFNTLPMLNSTSMPTTSSTPCSLPVRNVPAVNNPAACMSLEERFAKCLFFVTLSGLKPGWDYGVVVNMLKGIFVIKENVRFQRDHYSQTGTVFVKVCNKHDYKTILHCPTYFYKKKVIHVSECPQSVYSQHFKIPEKPSDYESCLKYYRLKGLPYDVSTERVLAFFQDLEVVDLYIVYAKYSRGYIREGKAVGIAFIAFGNQHDYEKAFCQCGSPFLNSSRIIYLKQSSKREMLTIKKKNEDLLIQSSQFVPARNPRGFSITDLPVKRPLCVLVTGIPASLTEQDVVDYFGAKGADSSFIHIPVDERSKMPLGKAFLALDSLLAFDKALQCNGAKMEEHTLSVKQILHDEMLKCLPEYDKYMHIWKLQESMPSPVRQVPKEKTLFRKSYEGSLRDHILSSEYRMDVLDSDGDSRDSVLCLDTDANPKNINTSFERHYHDINMSPERDLRESLNVRRELKDFAPRQGIHKSSAVESTLGHLNKRIQVEKDRFENATLKIEVKNTKARSPMRSTSKMKRSSRWSDDESSDSSFKPSFSRTVSVRTKDRSADTDEPYRKSSRPKFGLGYRPKSREDVEIVHPERHPSPPRRVRKISPHYSNHNMEGRQKPKEAIVQLSNVDTYIGSAELMDFFSDFDIDIDKIVRRVTDGNKPTGDVRVSFKSRKDAQRAVKTMNGSYINGLRIDMFIVHS